MATTIELLESIIDLAVSYKKDLEREVPGNADLRDSPELNDFLSDIDSELSGLDFADYRKEEVTS